MASHYESSAIAALAFLDLCISAPSLYVLQLHIWDKKLFNPRLWKIYAFSLCAWDLVLNVFIGPVATGEAFDLSDLIGMMILLPLYFGVFRYAFRKWDEVEGK